MKLIVRLLLPLSILVSNSSALAVTHVWSSASAPSGGGTISASGASGQDTLLRCDVGVSFCSWTVAMYFQNDAGDSPSIAWSLDYASSYALSEVSVDPGSLSYSPSPFTTHLLVPSYGVSPGPILTDANGDDVSGVGSSGGNLGFFTLRKTNSAASPLTTILINVNLGGLQWSDDQGNCPYMQFGGSPAVLCFPPQLGSSAPITIEMVPEPAAIALLVMTSLAVLRRRR